MDRPRASFVLPLFIYAVLTAVYLWPIFRSPATALLPAPDAYGIVWGMAWVVHQVFDSPARLFDANMYFPLTGTLALNEAFLPQALQGAPFIWAGEPVLAYNVTLILTFVLSGLGACLLAYEIGASRTGGLIAGLVYAFFPYRFDHLLQLHHLSIQWLPFLLIFALRSLRTGGWRNRLLAAFFFLLQALSSGYYAVLAALSVAVVIATHLGSRALRAQIPRFVLGLALAGALLAVVFVPYRTAMRSLRAAGAPANRTTKELQHWSARWSSYANPGKFIVLPHQEWLFRRFGGPDPLYAGAATLVLAGLALCLLRRDPSVQIAASLAAVGVLLSLGPQISIGVTSVTGPFEWIRGLPAVSMLRTPARMGVLAVLGLSLLAALGWTRFVTGRLATILLGPVILAFAVELYPAGLAAAIRPAEAPPPTVAWLAHAPRGAVLELPWDHETAGLGALYLYWSIGHWQPLVNGWSAFEPKGPFGLGVIGKLFPSDYSSQTLRNAGVRYVVVHLDKIPTDRPGRFARATTTGTLPAGVSLAADFGVHRVYELAPP